MTKKIDISVVIPVFQNVAAATQAYMSVLNQSVPAFEIILVDDCSAGEAAEQLDRLAHRWSYKVNTQVLHLPSNVGPGLARHEGAKRSTGEYVAFLDADDTWHADKIRHVTNELGKTKAELLGHYRPWDLNLDSQVLVAPIPSFRTVTLTKKDFLLRNPIPTSSITASSAIAREMFGFGGRRSEDYMALLVAATKADQVRFLQANLAWAHKPPFGVSGEGADQFQIYIASLRNVHKLYKKSVITAPDYLLFLAVFLIRLPIGMVRLIWFRKKYSSNAENLS